MFIIRRQGITRPLRCITTHRERTQNLVRIIDRSASITSGNRGAAMIIIK